MYLIPILQNRQRQPLKSPQLQTEVNQFLLFPFPWQPGSHVVLLGRSIRRGEQQQGSFPSQVGLGQFQTPVIFGMGLGGVGEPPSLRPRCNGHPMFVSLVLYIWKSLKHVSHTRITGYRGTCQIRGRKRRITIKRKNALQVLLIIINVSLNGE